MLDSCLWYSILNRTKTCLYCVCRGWCQLAVLSPRKLTLGGSVSPQLALPDHASFDLCSIVGHLLVCAVAEKSSSQPLWGTKDGFLYLSHIDVTLTQTGHQCMCVQEGSGMVEALREITAHFMAAFSQRDVTMHTQTHTDALGLSISSGPRASLELVSILHISVKGLAVIARSLWSKLVLIQIQLI